MQITLRRAAKLKSKIIDRLAEIRAEILAARNLFVNVTDQNAPDQIRDAQNSIQQNFARFLALSNIHHDLRKQIGAVNASKGVNELLTMNVVLTQQKVFIQQILRGAFPALNTEQIEARVALARTQLEQGHGYTAEIQIPVLTAEMIAALQADERNITLTIDRNVDVLESINAAESVTLSDSELAVLTGEGLI